jgi:hypothetical protein
MHDVAADTEETRMKVEPGIPIPPAKTRRRYPFKTMAIGDSFPLDYRLAQQTANAATYRYAPKRFACRKVGGVDGWRIWRVA